MGSEILQIWPIVGLAMLFVPLMYDRRKGQLLNILIGVALSTAGYCVFCSHSCLWFALYSLGFIGLNAYFLPKLGIFDADFAAKKFVYYQLLAFILLYFSSDFLVGSNWETVLFFISFGIMLAGYPFHGWFEPFMMHAPSGLSVTYLTFFYPLCTFFMLKNASLVAQNEYLFEGISLGLGILGALFVPLLFFARLENRRFLAYLATWNTGIIFLFMAYCTILDFVWLLYFGILQGISFGILNQSFVYLHHKLKHDNLLNINEIQKKFCFFIKLALCATWVLPLIFAGFFIKLTPVAWGVLVISLALYGFFLKNLLQGCPEKNYFSFE